MSTKKLQLVGNIPKNADDVGAVSYDAAQTLTDEQKIQARENIELSDSTLLTNVIATLPSSANWRSVTYGDGRFVTIAYNSNIAAYSDDSINWTETTLCSPDRWYSVTYGNGRFVAVGYVYLSSTEYYAIINYSDDGINWSELSFSPDSVKLYSVTYGNNRFVTVAYNSNQAFYSDDGITWTQTALPTSANWQCVTYSNGRFVAVAYNSNIAAYSDDGVTWTKTTLPSSANWYSVTYGNGRFVAVANSSTAAAYSNDGITWTETTLPSSAKWYSITYGNGKFVAVAYNSTIAAYSDDGVTWTETTLPSSANWRSVTYGDGKFVTVAYNSNIFVYSTDGINWYNTTDRLQNTSGEDIASEVKNALNITPSDIGAQKKLTGTEGQIVGFDNDGNAIAQDVTSGTVAVTIPKGRMKGDINGDGVITNADINLLMDHMSGKSDFISSDEIARWCSDIDGSESITASDGTTLLRYLDSQETPLTTTPLFADYYNNWTYVKIDNLTGYWTTDVQVSVLNTSMSAIIAVSGTFEEGMFYQAEILDGAIRIYSSRPPIDDVPCIITYISGDGTATICVGANLKHAYTHTLDGSDPITPADIGAQAVLTGTQGQIVGFDDGGNAVARNMPTADEVDAISTSGGTMTGDLILNNKALKIKIPDSVTVGITHEATLSGVTSYKLTSTTGGGISLNTTNEPALLFNKPVGFQSGLSAYGNRIYAVSDPRENSDAANKWYVDSKSPKSVTITLSASGWNNTAKTQTVTVSGVLADESAQLITPTPASASQAAYYEAGIVCTGQAADSLTFTATKVPTSDLTVYVVIQEVTSA